MSTKFVSILLVTFFASAANAALVAVPSDKINTYRDAIQSAMWSSKLTCSNHKTLSQNAVDVMNNYFTDPRIYVDRSGAQPSIVLSNVNEVAGGEEINITTSADYKTIIQARVLTMRPGERNDGTLLDPNMKSAMTTILSVVCQ